MTSNPPFGEFESIMARMLPHLGDAAGYASVQPPERLMEESGLDTGALVKVDANENPYGPTPKVSQFLGSFGDAAIYPDPEQVALRTALADYTGFGPDRIVGAAGSDELIDLLLRLFVAPGDRVITATPTFGMYAFSTGVVGGEFEPIPRKPTDFAIDTQAMVGPARNAKLVFLASPNNPTGNSVEPRELITVLETGVILVVDEAYQEFSSRPSAAVLLDEYPNLVVLRTFSKWAGLAGLRVGYGLFPAELAAMLMRVKPPYNVSTLAQAAAVTALEDRETALERVRMIVEERLTLQSALSALPGAVVYPSDANFLLVRFPGADTRVLHARLRARGIALRWFDSAGLEDCIRVSVGTPEQNRTVIRALSQEMSEVARLG